MDNKRHFKGITAYTKRRKTFSLVSVIVLVAFFVTVTAVLWKPLVGTFQKPEQFRKWVDLHGFSGILKFVGIVALQVIFAIIPGEPIELGAGYAFGTVEGTILCLIGDAIGTSIIFLFTKLLGIRLVKTLVGKEKLPSLRFIKNSKNRNTLIFLLFFIPGTPKDVFTYVVGLTPTKLTSFLILTSFARIPSVLTSTITGNALGVQDYRTALLVYAVTGIISFAGILIYRKIAARIQYIKKNKLKIVPDEESEEHDFNGGHCEKNL